MQALDFMQWDCNIKRRASGVPLNKISGTVEEKSSETSGWERKMGWGTTARHISISLYLAVLHNRYLHRSRAIARDLAGVLKCASYSPPIVAVIYYAPDPLFAVPLFLCLLKCGLDITVARFFNSFNESPIFQSFERKVWIFHESFAHDSIDVSWTFSTIFEYLHQNRNVTRYLHLDNRRSSYEIRFTSFHEVILSTCHEIVFAASYNYFRISRTRQV